MSEEVRKRLLRLRDKLHEASCDLIRLYIEVERDLKERVEEERRQELFDMFVGLLHELQSIRQSLDSIVKYELKKQEAGA
jgi:hypothetical protein